EAMTTEHLTVVLQEDHKRVVPDSLLLERRDHPADAFIHERNEAKVGAPCWPVFFAAERGAHEPAELMKQHGRLAFAPNAHSLGELDGLGRIHAEVWLGHDQWRMRRPEEHLHELRLGQIQLSDFIFRQTRPDEIGKTLRR